jgi:hypothetical protein
MPEWKRIVSENMSALNLPSGASEEVIAELAVHMEETYESVCARGLSNSAAMEQTLQEVGNWRVLATNIARAKSEDTLMNTRTKSLWLPAMLTLLGASTSLMVVQFAGFQPRLVWVAHTGVLLYWHWLGVLPLFGALGAYLSQRGHGSTRARIAAGLSPALVMLAVMFVILPFGLAIDGFSFFRLVHFGIGLANWVALPGLALLVGALPFLKSSEPLKA